MKSFIVALSLIASANVFAKSVVDSTALTSASPFLSSVTSSGGIKCKEAALVLNDAQDLIQNGKLSPFLNQKIKEVVASNDNLSESDALDILINNSQEILANQ